MDFYTVLGRTGLRVSVAGLGCGGPSRLGLARGADRAEAVALVRRALDLGINFVDTAAVYGTEAVVGEALAGRRGDVVLSSKVLAESRRGPLRADELVRIVEKSLSRLRTDVIDVYHLHGVVLDQYAHCLRELLPALHALRDAGKIRFVGISERFGADPQHQLLDRALRDDAFDVVMVGFNLLNPSARERVLAPAERRGVGTLVMFAVRRALSQPGRLRAVAAELHARGALPDGLLDAADPLGFLVHEGGAESVVDAAYRFCRHEPGVHVVLTGTGSAAHLEANVRSLERGPLPAADLQQLRALFGGVDFVSGD